MTRHIRLHTKNKDYGCEQCEFKSACKLNLARHVQTHVVDAIDRWVLKVYRCGCGYESNRSDLVKRHSAGHKTFPCKICNFKCSRMDSLTRHVKSHNV